MSQTAAGEIFDRYMAQLCAVWGHANTPDLLCAYWVVLGKYSAKQIEQAFTRTLQAADRWPTPAQLVARMDHEPKHHDTDKPITPWTEEQKAEVREMVAKLRAKCALMEVELNPRPREEERPARDPPRNWQDVGE